MFTKKEKNLFIDSYFCNIRENDQFIEVESVCTGHCWNVFKNTFEAGKKVVLYHKHKKADKYYHEHRICRTVAEAVEQIRQYDEYTKNQRGKAQQSQPAIESRKLKVYSKYVSNKSVPQIMLQGEWLQKLGFEIGSEIKVECQDGKLMISKQ